MNTNGAIQKPTWTHIGPQENHKRIDYIVTHVLVAQSKKAWTDFTAPVALSGYRDHRPVRAMIPTKAIIAKTTPTQRPPQWNSHAPLEARWDERYAEILWRVALALKKYLDERGGRITDPAGAYNYLEHHMVLPHFSLTRESAKKNQTPISDHTLQLVRKKQAILKALATAHGTKKFLVRCRLSAEAREMQRQVKNAVRCERRGTTEALAEKAEIARKGDTRTRKMAPPQRLPTQTVRQCCPTTGALGERCWTQDEEMDARTHALEYIFEETAGESPVTKVDDPKEQATVTTGCSERPFDADDVFRAVKSLSNYKEGPNIVRNEGEQLASGATAEVWKLY